LKVIHSITIYACLSEFGERVFQRNNVSGLSHLYVAVVSLLNMGNSEKLLGDEVIKSLTELEKVFL